MTQLTTFEAGHEDLIHGVAYDFYGTKLATCSSDQRIKVWEADDTGAWVLNEVIKAHSSSVIKVAWAHPEFGLVFASCSADRQIRVWEEQEHEQRRSGHRWVKRAELTDAKGSVHDIEFAPNHFGAKLASIGADGHLRIYEAMDPIKLHEWTLMDDIEIAPGISKESEGLFCLSWCQSRMEPQMMVVGCGRDNTARIYRQDSHNKWVAYEQLPGHGDVICDVAWAPSMGRTYHLIATACKDGHVRIFKLTDESSGSGGAAVIPQGGQVRRRFRVECVADLRDHNAEVWRVEWNITGTILSSSGDDGKVRMWKASFTEGWKCISVMGAEFDGDAPTK